MTTQIEALLATLTDAGMTAKIWQDRRIYFNGYGRDIKAFIELDEQQGESDPDNLFYWEEVIL